MSMNNQGRPTSVEKVDPNRRRPIAPGTVTPEELATVSGDRGLDHEEALIFELDHGAIGVDFADVKVSDDHLGGMRRTGRIGLPGLSEPEVIRHYVRLSRKNYAIDSGLYPLGSCTMKHNPRLNEKMARLPGFGDLHPLAPASTTQGALELISQLMNWLTTLTGMPAVAGLVPWADSGTRMRLRSSPRAAMAARMASRPHNSPCAPALGDIATAGMPVSLVSQVISWEISSSAPCVVDWGANGCRSPKPGSRAIFSFRRGLCFMVQEPSG